MNVILATSGTGGHLIPAVKVAHELKGRGVSVMITGSNARGLASDLAPNIRYADLGCRGLTARNPLKILRGSALIARGVWRARKIFREFEPDAVIGFGGYAAVPVAITARLRGVPVILHEQNVVPGKANRLLGRMSKKIALSFRETQNHFPGSSTVVTGCPCHFTANGVDRASLRARMSLDENTQTVLVFGGSLGSRAVNTAALKAAEILRKSGDAFQVIHICGEADYEHCREEYDRLGVRVHLKKYCSQMQDVYKAADFVVARSGALSVNEIALYRLRAVLIPYPFAGGHQMENARVLEKYGDAVIIEQKDLTPAKLAEAVREGMKKGPQEHPSGPSDTVFYPDAEKRISDEIMKLTA